MTQKSMPAELKQSWEELDKSGKLIGLLKNDPVAYATIFIDTFGRNPLAGEGLKLMEDKEKVNAYRNERAAAFPYGKIAKELKTAAKIKPVPGGLTQEGLAAMRKRNLSDAGEVKKTALPEELYMGWDKLDKAGKLEKLKSENYTLWSLLYNNRFGELPTGWKKQADYNAYKIYEDAYKQHRLAELAKMTWDEVNAAGAVQELERLSSDMYKEKFFKKFGVYPKY